MQNSAKSRPGTPDGDATHLMPIVLQFARNATRQPNRVALVDVNGDALSYAELNARANRLAHQILGQRGQKEEGVAFLSGLESASVISLLGIWKAAKFYIGLDPNSPRERLEAILQDVEAKLIVTNQANLELAKQLAKDGIQVINLDAIPGNLLTEDPNVEVRPEALAAVFYTSGSTGAPKGVTSSHMAQAFNAAKSIVAGGYEANDRIVQPFGFSFAWSLSRVYLALVPGGTLYLCNYNTMSVTEIASWLLDNKITALVMTSNLFSQFTAALPENLPEKFPHLRQLNIGGESFTPRLLLEWKKHFSPHSVVSSSFASSEAGIMTRTEYAFDTEVNESEIRFGRPDPGVKLMILDDEGHPLSTGETGRIAVSSLGMTSGYWRRPDLNEELFIPDPENPDASMLLTNDLGRLHPDGSLEFRGRQDAMLKVRGFRVEPGEIEAVLRKHPAVQNAAVAGFRPPASEEITLVAYAALRTGKAAHEDELRNFLAGQLPQYMVPVYYVVMDKIPLTSNGKIDRNTLLEPDWDNLRQEYKPAQTQLEADLVLIWEQILKKARIGINDDFFKLGGHSLAAFRITAKIQEKLGPKLPLQVLLSHPTIRELANAIESGAQEVLTSTSVTVVREPSDGPSLFMVPGVARTSVGLNKLADYIDPPIGVYGLEYPGMGGYLEPIDDTEKLAAFFVEQILAIQSQGPYFIAGQCFGGVIAFEMARQLSAQGHEIGRVILLDSSPPGMRDDELDGREPMYYFKRMLIMLQRDNRAGIIPLLTRRLRGVNPFSSSRTGLPQLSWTENPLDDESLQVAHATRNARNTYKPETLDARGLAVMSSMARGTARETWWRRLFNGLECHYIPGTTHQNIFKAEHSLQKIGELLSKAILPESK